MKSFDRNLAPLMDTPPPAAGFDRPPDAAKPPPVRLGRWALACLALIVIGGVVGLVPRLRQAAALRSETRELAVPTVSVVSPVRGQPAAGPALPAEVRPTIEAPILARASGYLKRWLVDIGSPVEAGQLLAEIDTPELDQQLAQARAQLAESDAALTLAKTTASRWSELLKTASVSEQEAAEKQADLELKSATVGAAKANVSRLEDLRSFALVKAPFAGTITMRGTDFGDLITAGSPRELFHLAQTRKLRVFVQVPQALAGGIAPGQPAELLVPDVHDRVFPATVVRTAGAMNADSRTLLTELEVDNPRGEILAGSFAQVRFSEANAASVLTLPSNTLLFNADGLHVGVVKSDGKVELRRISLGRDFGATMEVLSGVNLNDRVILNPADSLVDGATVRVAETPPTAAAKP